jgi:cation transporter-like permease
MALVLGVMASFFLYFFVKVSLYDILFALLVIVATMAMNLMVVPVIVTVSMFLATYTSRRGWNPDNFVMAIESVLSDGITTLARASPPSAYAFRCGGAPEGPKFPMTRLQRSSE